jgi:hypothetical protein
VAKRASIVLVALLALPPTAGAGELLAPLAGRGSGLLLPLPPSPSATNRLESERRALEVEWALQGLRRDQRRSAEELRIREHGDLGQLDEYRAREWGADQSRALSEALDRRALESRSPGAQPGFDALRQTESLQEQRDLELRTRELEQEIRARLLTTP